MIISLEHQDIIKNYLTNTTTNKIITLFKMFIDFIVYYLIRLSY
jgi:hypothetical protein